MIWPAEADDAVDALEAAQQTLRETVDRLAEQRAPTSAVAPFVQAMRVVTRSIGHVREVMSPRRCAGGRDMEAVEERHVDAQIMPWVEDWDRP